MTNYRRTFLDGVFVKDKKYSMGERKALSPILLKSIHVSINRNKKD